MADLLRTAVEELVAAMDRAAERAEDSPAHPITHFDAREWTERLRLALAATDKEAHGG